MNLKLAVIFIVIGLISGWMATRVMGERDSGLARSLGIGVVGAVLGGYGAQFFGMHATGFLGHLVIGFMGSLGLLFLLKQLR